MAGLQISRCRGNIRWETVNHAKVQRLQSLAADIAAEPAEWLYRYQRETLAVD
jgi:hypothetical protein